MHHVQSAVFFLFLIARHFNVIGVYAYGFEKPSSIQQRAVKPIILGRDLIVQAQSGEVQI